MQLPAAHVVAAGNHVRADAFGHPCLHHEVTDLSFDPEEIAGAYRHAIGVDRVDPQRVAMGDLGQPLGVGAAGVDVDRQAERRDQHHLIPIDAIAVDVTLDVRGHGVFRPAPLGKGRGVKFELAAGCGEAAQDLAIHGYTHRPASLVISFGAGLRHNIRAGRLRRPGEDPSEWVLVHVLQFGSGDGLLVDRIHA